MTDIYRFLDEHHIPYARVDHPPVYTCEEAERLFAVCSTPYRIVDVPSRAENIP